MNKRYVEPGGGRRFEVIGGDQIAIKATGEDTDGAFTVIETVVPAGCGPPRHLHRRESETFYVLDGEFEFEIGKETIHASVGAFLVAPPDLPHQFRNVTDRPAKLLIVCQPAGFEKFVEEFATIPTDVPPDPQQMAAIGAKYGIEFVPADES